MVQYQVGGNEYRSTKITELYRILNFVIKQIAMLCKSLPEKVIIVS